MLITVMRVLVFLWGCDEAGIGKILIYQKKKNRGKDCQRKKVTDRTEEEQKS